MSHCLERQKVHSRMVKEDLKAVARANHYPYQSVFSEFTVGHPSCTVCFWETFHKTYPLPCSSYEYFMFCHTCRRFDLYETEAEMDEGRCPAG
ncbi:hypothetical protein [Escherichia coli]